MGTMCERQRYSGAAGLRRQYFALRRGFVLRTLAISRDFAKWILRVARPNGKVRNSQNCATEADCRLACVQCSAPLVSRLVWLVLIVFGSHHLRALRLSKIVSKAMTSRCRRFNGWL